jgi:putative resolvase
MPDSCAEVSIIVAMSKIYRINEFARRIGRATGTVRRWER